MAKKALMVVSFGTSVEIAIKAIENIENICQKAFPDYDFFRAFTSGFIIRKLKRTRNLSIYSPAELMDHLVEEGYDEVICQPTHIISGIEYDKMYQMLSPYKDRIPLIRIGAPLLTSDEDYMDVCEITMNELDKPLADSDALIFMGHGTDHQANNTYFMFENTLRDLGYDNAYMATVEGFPDLDYVIRRIQRKGIENVTLMPLLIVAGDHARNDLAGDQEDSWKNILKAENFNVNVIMQGLGEIDAIGQMYAKHAAASKAI